ncbi:OmpA family protein [Emticicia sp. BO119]|uniref:OmpA family protein n=1 Tax=Emticicia sp. BO119 TaxID=2757768 RepID=UPI0015EFFB81|nr:OmpA family protein [Emticicia sp. BO119]MBA4849668.1 OmpA family protein [Emticicia sp. BO119]
MNKLFSSLLLICMINVTMAQDPKAKEYYNKGIKSFVARKSDDATESLLKAIERDSTYADAYFKLGQMSETVRNEGNALKYYAKAIQFKPNEPTYRQAYTYIGTRALRAGEYEKAKTLLEFSLKNSPPNSLIVKQLTKQLESCNFAIKAQKKKLSFDASDMGEVINFKNNQYFPVLTADNETLIFTARSEEGDENLFYSQLVDGKWTKPVSISSNINTPANEGTCSISADGRTLVFTSCDARDSFGSCDLYISRRVGSEWSAPENLGANINTREWESQPSLSNDGHVLYFSSKRQGGFGEKDLWVSELKNNVWSPALNLGNTINTPKDDISPFIHANGHTLFFASEGHTGLGGFDLYMTEQKLYTFTKPENLGYPINTHEDQVALFVTSDGKKGYYSSDTRNTTRLYEFDIPQELSNRFSRVNYVKGFVQDAQTKKYISADIELIDLKTGETLERVQSDAMTGEYTAILPNGSHFGLYISKNDYLNVSLSFDFSEKTDVNGKVVNIALQPFKPDTDIVLHNIFFDSGKADLKPESFFELDKLKLVLETNPKIKIEISGHTDNVGRDTDNLGLSQKRAEAVVNYLISKGVNAANIKAVGYGETRPIASNDTEESRQFNRRIEMKIL